MLNLTGLRTPSRERFWNGMYGWIQYTISLFFVYMQLKFNERAWVEAASCRHKIVLGSLVQAYTYNHQHSAKAHNIAPRDSSTVTDGLSVYSNVCLGTLCKLGEWRVLAYYTRPLPPWILYYRAQPVQHIYAYIFVTSRRSDEKRLFKINSLAFSSVVNLYVPHEAILGLDFSASHSQARRVAEISWRLPLFQAIRPQISQTLWFERVMIRLILAILQAVAYDLDLTVLCIKVINETWHAALLLCTLLVPLKVSIFL